MIEDLKQWINNTFECQAIASNLVIATFVIDLNGDLRLADRLTFFS